MAKETFERNHPHIGGEPPPPPPPPPGSLAAVTTAGVLTTLEFTFSTNDQAGSYYAVYATLGMGTGITAPPKQAFRLIASTENNGLLGTLDVLSAYNNAFPYAEIGSAIFVRLFYINSTTGQKWNLGQYKATVSGT